MKNLIQYAFPAVCFLFFACEKEVELTLDTAEPMLVVDAWLTNKADVQQISLTYTRAYFYNDLPSPATGAVVNVVEEKSGSVYSFTDDDGDGVYQWAPTDPAQTFGQIGSNYLLTIGFKGATYHAISRMDSVPAVDSITFEYYRADSFIKEEYYVGDFWSRDLPGVGDAYWIKTWKNTVLLNQPSELNLAYDAGISAGGEVDSLIFIQPIRSAINPFIQDANGMLIPPYQKGDSVYIEIHAIAPEAWFFLARVRDETNRPGGFGELFSTPLANVPTNIESQHEGVHAVGFFNVSAVSSLGVLVGETTIRDNLPD